MANSAAGRRRRRHTLPMAARSTRSINPDDGVPPTRAAACARAGPSPPPKNNHQPNQAMPLIASQSPSVAEPFSTNRRSLADLIAPLDRMAANSASLVANHEAKFEVGGETYELPRYLFIGPQGGDAP